jgi:hypothetical protein
LLVFARQYQTALAVGFFLGALAMMSQTMFMNFVYFLSKGNRTSDDVNKKGDRTFAAFCFLLCVGYVNLFFRFIYLMLFLLLTISIIVFPFSRLIVRIRVFLASVP